MNCQHCQSLLLDHLYGLLDGAEAAEVETHLASCPACAAARAETARLQGLIARAAKSAFPGTKFEPPAPQPQPEQTRGGALAPAATAPAALTPTATGHKGRPLSRRIAAAIPWVIAASVLAGIPATVVPVLGIFDRATRARSAAEFASADADRAATARETARAERQRRLDDARFKLTAAEQAQTALLNKWREEQAAAIQATAARRLTVDVQKPATVQPGAPNDFVVVVNDRRPLWETTGKRLVAEIHAVGASDAVIFTQPLNNERAAEQRHPLRLPASAWAKMKPGAELFLVVAQVDEKTQARTELPDRIRLAGPVFTTLLATDKATYRPGDRLFFRSLTLDRVTFRPPAREQILKFELLHPDGRPLSGLNVTGTTNLVRLGAFGLADQTGGQEAGQTEGRVGPVRTPDGQPVRGVGCGEFILPPDLPDGDYTLRLTEGRHPDGFAPTLPLPVTRVVKVRAGVPDNYRKEIGFACESFAPGETVEAWADLKFQNGPVPGAAVEAVAVEVDGQPLTEAEVAKQTDKLGRAVVRFPLPAEVLRGDVRLKVTFRTPLGNEVVARRVPVISNRVVVEFFPECGNNLVAGVPCKVYVRATTPSGQPVNFRGVITDGRQTLAKVESLSDKAQPGANRGLASFTYSPQLGQRVWLKLESPSAVYAPIMTEAVVPSAAVALMGGPGAVGARTGFMLPLAQPDGVVMSVLNPVTAPGEPIRVRLHSVGQPRALVVGAYVRGKLGDTQKVTVEPDVPQVVQLMAGADPLTGGRGGVVRITAFEERDDEQDLKPVAERLAFRKPGEVLKLAFAASAGDGQPGLGMTFGEGAEIKLSLAATDEKGNPASAVLWAAAVNSGAAPGEKDRLLPTHFLLAGEVKSPDELEYADFLLTDHPKAAEALDLLLGTQGWRRFAEQSIPQVAAANQLHFRPAATAEFTKFLVQNGQYATWTEPDLIRARLELHRKFAPPYGAAVKAALQARSALEAATRASQDASVDAEATAAAESARRHADEKAAQAEQARRPLQQFRANVWYGVAGLAVLAAFCGLGAFLRATDRLPLGFSTLGSVGLAVFLVIAAGWDEQARASGFKADALALNAPAGGPEAGGERAEPPAAAAAPLPSAPPPAPTAPELGAKAEPKTEAFKVDGTSSSTVNGATALPFAAPPAGRGGGMLGKAQAMKPAQAPFVPNPPPMVFSQPGNAAGPNRWAHPMASFGMGGLGGPPTPAVPAAMPAMPAPARPLGGAPSVVAPGGILPGAIPPPAPAPGPMLGVAGTGWDPARPGGVSVNDLVTSQFSTTDRSRRKTGERKQGADPGAVQKKEAALAVLLARDSSTAAPQVFATVSAVPPLIVREYAAPRPSPAQLAEAVDAPDTVLWQPVIVLPAEGKATLEFSLGNAPGGYEILIAGHTLDGRLGATRGLIRLSPATTPAAPVPGKALPPVVPAAPPSQPMP